MTSGKWERTKSLFEAALEQGGSQWEEFLDRACPDDDEVRKEALRLLRERDRLETEFLEPPGKQTLLDRAARSLASDPPARCPGEVLAERYVVEREIGRGGSGVVYLARDRQLHSRPVVVKFLHAGWEEHARLKARFLLEIEALSRIRHSGVVGVLDVGQAPDGRSFLVMEYVEGATLRSLLEEGTVALPQATGIVDMVGEALDAAHQCGILHRDLKPENIMLEPAGAGRTIVKLIDFGIAKVQYEEPGTQTETVTILGTVRYVAPEQLMGRSEPRSDIYALGVVCYEMLTGRRPFEPETPFQLYEMQRAGKVTPPSRLRKDLPKRADHAILRALSFRPENRQSSAREFAAEFRRGRERKLPPFRKWVRAGVVSAALFLTAAAGWRWTQGGWGSYEHVIQTVGGRNPEDAGFQKRLDLVERAVYNQERTGIDAIRLLSGDQGFYYHKLTRAQAYSAMRNGWSAAATLRSAQGAASLDIDLTPASHRYGLNVFLNPSGRQVVQLTATIADAIDGPRYEIEGPQDAYHDYHLIFDPGTREARLLVDGVERLRGYHGHSEYLEGWGVVFGTALYRSEKAETLFKRVRFEIAEPRL